MALLLSILILCAPACAASKDGALANCAKDAMIAFDAYGSMTGMGFGETAVRRIEQVRRALAEVLPTVAPARNLGLMVFGPGKRDACENVDLKLRHGPNSAASCLKSTGCSLAARRH